MFAAWNAVREKFKVAKAKVKGSNPVFKSKARQRRADRKCLVWLTDRPVVLKLSI